MRYLNEQLETANRLAAQAVDLLSAAKALIPEGPRIEDEANKVTRMEVLGHVTVARAFAVTAQLKLDKACKELNE